MAALTLFVFSLLVSTTFAIDETQNTQVVDKEERPAFQALPLQLNAGQKEFYFHLYFNEIFDGKDKNSQTVVSPNTDFPNFSEIGIMDVPLYDGLKTKKVIARAQGTCMQADLDTYGWLTMYNIVFELAALKGSTLQIMGSSKQLTTSRQWSIIGGTGVFTMAQGQVYGRRLSSPDESLWIELKMHGYYTPMQMPPWNPTN